MNQEGQSPEPGATITPGDNTHYIPPENAASQPVAAYPESDPTGLQSEDGGISWTASEFIAHEKSGGWYLRLALVSLFIAGVVVLLTRDKISAVVVLVGAVLFGIVASRQPRQLDYSIDNEGVTIGQKRIPYEQFRSFSVVPEGAFSSIVFMPLKRFATTTTIYFAPGDEERIINLLSDRLPFEEQHHDPIEKLMRRVRF